jgi:hypothetical protein
VRWLRQQRRRCALGEPYRAAEIAGELALGDRAVAVSRKLGEFVTEIVLDRLISTIASAD